MKTLRPSLVPVSTIEFQRLVSHGCGNIGWFARNWNFVRPTPERLATLWFNEGLAIAVHFRWGKAFAGCRQLGSARRREVGPHLDHAPGWGRDARRPVERGIEIGGVDDVVAAELLLGVGIGAVLRVTFAA